MNAPGYHRNLPDILAVLGMGELAWLDETSPLAGRMLSGEPLGRDRRRVDHPLR